MTVQSKLPTTDTLRSLVEGMSLPLTSKDALFGHGAYYLTDESLHAAYRNVWLARKMVDIPALDAIRKWRDWQADQNQITLIEAEERRLGLKQKLFQVLKLARLWGGGCIYIGTGENPETPLEPEAMGKGGLKYLTVMSRREMIADELDQDPVSEFYGLPTRYQVSNGRTFAYIHPSRLVLQVGAPLADVWTTPNGHLGWGDSILQAAYSTIMNVDTTAANIAALVFEANVDVFKVPDLMEHMASAVYRDKLINRFTLAAAGKSITKALLTDAEEEYDRKQIAFAGLPDVLQQFLIIASGAADIPLTRLLGQSPAGLNSTGEHDMKNYHDRVQSMQCVEVGPALWRLDECLIRSALGARPEEIFYSWAPLEQMSEKEKAEIAKLQAETTTMYVNSGLFMPEELREAATNQLVETGVYPGLGDLVKANGNDLPEFDLERRAAEAGVDALENPEPKEPPPGQKAADGATLRTLYVARPVLNGEDILAHYRAQGLDGLEPAEELHVTVVYSKMPVDWMKLGESWEGSVTLPASELRQHEAFGDGSYMVLRISAPELEWRHAQARGIGATHDWGEYHPHVTISTSAGNRDVAAVAPWTGPIVLGRETFEEVRE